MESFKYKGTPEQMAKVAEHFFAKGYKWWDADREGEVLIVDNTEPTEIFYCSDVRTVPPMSAALELEIFGQTDKITGNPKDEPAEKYFVEPKRPICLEDAYDNPNTGLFGQELKAMILKTVEPPITMRERRSEPRNKYMREIKPGVWVDVYDVIRAFTVTDGALQHLLKKALAVGQRGHKDAATDYKDILDSAKRAQEIYLEWSV